MDIKEIQEEQIKLESEITKLVNNFHTQTGVEISRISLNNIFSFSGFNLQHINVDVVIPRSNYTTSGV
jgi:hypothetical protein